MSDFSQKLVTPKSRGSTESRLVTDGDIGDSYIQGPEAAEGSLAAACRIKRTSWVQFIAIMSANLQHTNYCSDFSFFFLCLTRYNLIFCCLQLEQVSEARNKAQTNGYYAGPSQYQSVFSVARGSSLKHVEIEVCY